MPLLNCSGIFYYKNISLNITFVLYKVLYLYLTKQYKNMRTIRFRGISEVTNEFIYGNLIINGTDTFGNHFDYGIQIDGKHYPTAVNPETVGQFTGLCDKNGKEVYEGDLVSNKHQPLAKVIWQEKFTTFCTEEIDEDVSGDFQYTMKPTETNILGNIHQNPELLK